MMTPTDYVSNFVYEQYVRPAVERGDKTVTISACEVCNALHGVHNQDFIGAILGSLQFRKAYGMALQSAELAATETYTFRLD